MSAQSPLVEVEEVALEAEATAHGLRIESPVAGTANDDTYSVPLDGSVEDAGSLLGLDVFHGPNRLRRILGGGAPIDGDGATGFSWPLNALALPPTFEAVVKAVLRDRSQVPLATIRGRRATLRSDFVPTLQPLSITSLGRSGSTVLIGALERHPDIAACPAFDYETTISLYWLSVLRDLAEPAGYMHQLVNHPDARKGGPEWWTAGQRPLPPPLRDPRVQQIAGRDAVHQLAKLCQAQIDLVYSELAERFGHPGAQYFAEKTLPGPVLSLQDELYPDGREIVLIRDFRDQLCSAIDFYPSKAVQPGDTERVLEFARSTRNAAMGLLERYRRAASRVHVLRYEDMVLAPTEAFASLLEYLALPADPGVLAQMAEAIGRRDDKTESHRTVSDPAASIGRWQRDLHPDVVEAADAELRAPLEAFGYS